LCLVATADETYTYNQKINQMTPIQEHFMIMKAIKAGVPEERIAATLNINVSRVREKQNLLSGICLEAVAMIKDRRVSAAALREIKRVKPLRQIEMADLMITSNNFTLSYAKCLYAGTTEDQKLGDQRPKEAGMQPAETLKMQRELESVSREYKTMHESYGENVLNLVLCGAYLKKLLQNSRVARFLAQKHADIAGEFQRIVDSPELDRAA
jgi:hypothetical protein